MYVIDGLKRRAHEDRDLDESAFRKYQNKYEQMYFSRDNDIGNWKNYKSYLQEQLKREEMEPYLKKNPRATFSPSPNAQSYSAEGSPLRKTGISRRLSRLRT